MVICSFHALRRGSKSKSSITTLLRDSHPRERAHHHLFGSDCHLLQLSYIFPDGHFQRPRLPAKFNLEGFNRVVERMPMVSSWQRGQVNLTSVVDRPGFLRRRNGGVQRAADAAGRIR